MAETIGQQLKFARLAQKLSIEDVVETTRIRPNYIEALEADNFDVFPSVAQGRGFLHNYVEFLGLNVEEMLTRQRETPAPTPDLTPAPVEEPAPAVTEPAAVPEEPEPFSWTEPLPSFPSTEIMRPPESLVSTPEPAPVTNLPRWDNIPAPEPRAAKKELARRSSLPKKSKPLTEKSILKPAKKEKKGAAVKTTVTSSSKGKKATPEKPTAPKRTAKSPEKETRSAVVKPTPKGAPAIMPIAEPAPKPRKKRTGAAAIKPSSEKAAPRKTTSAKPVEQKVTATSVPKGKKTPVVKPAARKIAAVEETPSVESIVKPAKMSAAVKKQAPRKKAARKVIADAAIGFETPPPPIPIFEPLPEITIISEQNPLESIRIPEETVPEPEPLPEPRSEPGTEIAQEPELQPPEIAVTSPETAKDIFTSIGKELSERRELLGMTLDEIERHTHVRRHYLETIESGEFDKLPSSVQARGMINNYARFLDMDADALLLRFADGLQIQRQERHPSGNGKPPRRGKVQRGIRRYLSVDMFIGGGLIVLLILFAVWGTNQIIAMRGTPTAEATAPSISEMLLVSPTAGYMLPTDTPVESPEALPTSGGQIEAAATLPTSSAGGIQVIVVALERAYVVVTVDGMVKFDGRVVPGTAYPFDAKNQIEVLTGNGAAIKITYNGTDLGVMGTFGQVVDLIYTSSAVVTPTSTSTPTATASPIPTATPVPSATPKPSITPRVTSTKTP